jgi:hypothetical protein
MTRDEFEAAVNGDNRPSEEGNAILAMWYDARGDWTSAHTEAQAMDDNTGAWIHAYLHRVEGDLSNAGYWYRRAGRPVCDDPLEEEREEILADLLAAE